MNWQRTLLPFRAALMALGLYAAFSAAQAAPTCLPSDPWGMPGVTDGHSAVSVCHEGYAAGLDAVTKEPRWVAYQLTAEHTLGCYPRAGLRFKVDPLAPAGVQGRPADYAHSGFDLGHMAPNQDFAWSKAQQRDTFSMANVNPQLPGLNRQGWERLEEDVRAWALQRGTLQVYVGPIYGGRQTIGASALPVPEAFFKVVLDPRTGEGLGFVMPQQPVRKGSVAPWRTAISEIEKRAMVTLPLPSNFSESKTVWAADLAGWRRQHSEKCRANP